VSGAQSGLARRLAGEPELRHALHRDVAGELAEQLIRLRRYRGLSQKALAQAIGTQQAAISRHESGSSNLSVKTLEAMLEALEAIVRIDVIPEEMEAFRASFPRWWVEAADAQLMQSSEVFVMSAQASRDLPVRSHIAAVASAAWHALLPAPRALAAVDGGHEE
jgi:transcriptional regulator with XRE-family HTH domain